MARPRKKPAAQEKKAAAKSKPAQVEVAKVEIYEDAEGDWRWRARAANYLLVAESGEGYNNRMYCKKVAHDLFPLAVIEFH